MNIALVLVLAVAFSVARVASAAEDAQPGECSYQISLQIKGKHVCGASLIKQALAVTAATCVQGVADNLFAVVAGETDLTTNAPCRQVRLVKNIVIHPFYSRRRRANDIALIFLDHDFIMDSNVSTIAMPKQNSETSGDLLVSGWGINSQANLESPLLKKAVIPFVSEKDCKNSYPPSIEMKSLLCAGSRGGDKGSCLGDLGGPLVSLDTKKRVGINLRQNGCRSPNTPGIFTKVSHFTDWIEAQNSDSS